MAHPPESAGDRGVRPPGDLNPRHEPALDFSDRPLHRMKSDDYEAIGFMAGLEVHQQLLTRSKLFCRCPAGRRVERVDAEVLRHMRPTLSELGEYDGTALMEFKTRKEIVYLLERGTVCTYEMDDTPPFEIDPDAVAIAVELAMLCNLNLVSELHVMRKQYLDGSIPTGFQRTAMIGLTGAIPFRVPALGADRELRIRQLSLEEDSCREVSDQGHRITFRTDRLGMPLTEVVTEPDLRTPLELQAGARLVAATARATGKVRRGAGAARQDVNVSVAGGRRIEIKGVHHHRGLPLLVHTEAFRQLNLLRIRAGLARRGIQASDLPIPGAGLPWDLSPLVLDVSALLARSGHRPLRQALERGDTACAIRLPGFRGILDHPTQPGLTFAHELAERVRVIACPAHHPFLAWADTASPDLGQRHWRQLRRALAAGTEDAIMVAWAPRDDAATAAREILIRAVEALVGVPAETRQARPDGTTAFERILPGPDRMYPDTDTPPLPLPDPLVAGIQARLPETPWDRESRYLRLGLPAESAHHLATAPWAGLFDRLAPTPGRTARRLATTLRHRLPFHARHGAIPDLEATTTLAPRLGPVVRALETARILDHAFPLALDQTIAHPDRTVEYILASLRPCAADDAALAARIADVAARAPSLLPDRPPATVLRWAMGEVMGPFRGRADPERVRHRLTALLSSVQEVPA
jgi:glutamyl-tRNA(Gln) amidotransferase subunit E